MKKLKISIFISVALSGLAFAIIMPILAPLIRELQLSESQGGAIVSIGSVTMAILAAFWGRLSDRIGRKPVILIGFAGLFGSYVIYTSVTWFGLSHLIGGLTLFVLLIVARAIIGSFLPAIVSSAQALMADNTSKDERSAGMALISAAQGVGMILGPGIGGALALFGIIWPLVIATLLFLVGFTYVWFNLPVTPPQIHIKPKKINPWDPSIWPWLLVGLVTFMATMTLMVSSGFYFQDQLGLTPLETAPVLAVALMLVGIVLVLTQTVQVKFLKWAPIKMVLVGSPFLIAGILVLLLTNNLWAYYGAYILFGVGAGLLMPAFLSGASLGVSADRQGAIAGLTGAVQGIAAIIAPIASTLLYEMSRTLPFWIIGGLVSGIYVLFLTLKIPQGLQGDKQEMKGGSDA